MTEVLGSTSQVEIDLSSLFHALLQWLHFRQIVKIMLFLIIRLQNCLDTHKKNGGSAVMVGSQNMREHQQSAIPTICKLKNDKDFCTMWFANFVRLWDLNKNIEAD